MILRKKIHTAELTDISAKSVGFVFGDNPEGGIPTQKVIINWPAATYSAEWSEKETRWLLSHNGKLNVADSGVVLGPTTLVIQMVKISPSEYGDKFGGVTPLPETIGTGKAYVLRDGELFATTWNRPFAESGTSFTLPDGSPMFFAPGQAWVS